MTTVLFLCMVFLCARSQSVINNLTSSEFYSLQFDVFSEFTKFCPYTNTCTAENNSTLFKPDNMPWDIRIKLPCCGQCNCDTNCGMDCCPDKPENISDQSNVKSAKATECIYAQYRTNTPRLKFANVYFEDDLSERKIFNRKYRMISKCPSNVSNVYNDGCNREYFDFDLRYKIVNFPPVTGKVSRKTFKNRECALCNGEREADLMYWKSEFVCQTDPPYVPKTFEEMLELVATTEQCNILFQPSVEITDAERCRERIDSCNVTGEWKAYDHRTALACLSYTSLYVGLYKNVHCFMCNGNMIVNTVCEESTTSGRTLFPSFIAVLDFNQLEQDKQSKEQEETNIRCPEKHMHNRIKDKCLPLMCGYGLVLTDNKCLPFFGSTVDTARKIIYGYTITFLPLQLNTSGQQDLERVHFEMFEQIIQTVVYPGFRICFMFSFIKCKRSIREVIANMFTSNMSFLAASDVEYVAFDIRIEEVGKINVSKSIEKVNELMVGLNHGKYKSIHRYIPETRFQRSTNNSFNPNITSFKNLTETDMLMSLSLSASLTIGLLEGYDDNEGRGMFQLFQHRVDEKCKTDFVVEINPFCPKVELVISEYNISFRDGYVYIADIGTQLNINSTSLSKNGDTLKICKDDYSALVKAYMFLNERNKDDTAYHTPQTTLTIICISFSLLSLVLTMIIYCLFPILRTVPGLNNMGLVLSLIIFFSLTLVNALTEIQSVLLCRIVGIVSHFALLSAFSWMFVCTFHMMKVFVTIVKRSTAESNCKTFIYYILFAEIIPVCIIVLTVLVSYQSSGGSSIGYRSFPCYVQSNMLLYNVAIPVGLVVVLNFAMFGYVAITISRLPDIRKDSTHSRNNIAIFIKLSTLTGLTWIVGFVYQFTEVEVFAYMFTILNASQGVFIMFAFVVNKRVYDMLRKKIEKPADSTKSKNSTSSTVMLSYK